MPRSTPTTAPVAGNGAISTSVQQSDTKYFPDGACDILTVIYCFERDIDLPALLARGTQAFERFAAVNNAESWIV